MKKIIKFFLPVVSVFSVILLTMTLVKADDWPPEGCPLISNEMVMKNLYLEAYKKRLPTATYCFFNPANGSMEHPARGTALDKIPVAICLQDARARQVFRSYYFLNTFFKLSLRGIKIDAYENVFIIPFSELCNIAKEEDPSKKIFLYTENGIIDGKHDVTWSWGSVLDMSCLLAGLKGGVAPGSAPARQLRVKVRSLMEGIERAPFGSTFRVCSSDEHIESDIWSGEDVIDTTIYNKCGGVSW